MPTHKSFIFLRKNESREVEVTPIVMEKVEV